MRRNWQLNDWLDFRFDADRIDDENCAYRTSERRRARYRLAVGEDVDSK